MRVSFVCVFFLWEIAVCLHLTAAALRVATSRKTKLLHREREATERQLVKEEKKRGNKNNGCFSSTHTHFQTGHSFNALSRCFVKYISTRNNILAAIIRTSISCKISHGLLHHDKRKDDNYGWICMIFSDSNY